MFQDFDWVRAIATSPVMVTLIICSVLTFTLAIERLLYYQKRRADAGAVLRAALDQVRAGKVQDAIWACRTSLHPVGPVAAHMLQNAHLEGEEAEEQLQLALGEQKLPLERNLAVLGTMGSVAPLIGLLGTVWGIIRAFQDMAHTGSAGPSVVAAGVADALLATAAGLVVAVPSVLLYNHFVRRMTVMLALAEHHARTLRLAARENASETSARRAA